MGKVHRIVVRFTQGRTLEVRLRANLIELYMSPCVGMSQLYSIGQLFESSAAVCNYSVYIFVVTKLSPNNVFVTVFDVWSGTKVCLKPSLYILLTPMKERPK